MDTAVAGHGPAARRSSSRTGVLAVMGLALLFTFGAWLWSLSPADGPLVDVHGDLTRATVTPGEPFTYGMISLQNVGPVPVVLLAATMGPHTLGLRMVGAGVSRNYAGYVLDPRGYPRLAVRRSIPGRPRPTMSAVQGAIIPGGPSLYPRANVATLVVGLRVDRPGTYVLRGMVVTYRAGRSVYTERIGPTLAVCTPKPGHEACRLPEFVPW